MIPYRVFQELKRIFTISEKQRKFNESQPEETLDALTPQEGPGYMLDVNPELFRELYGANTTPDRARYSVKAPGIYWNYPDEWGYKRIKALLAEHNKPKCCCCASRQ